MPTLFQRAETFIINTKNPVARELVRELVAALKSVPWCEDASCAKCRSGEPCH
jgi:hypothetical protein